MVSNWKLRDVILMVVFSIVCGGLYRVWDVLSALIPSAAYAGQAALTGLWMVAAILVPYVIRRPFAALLAELIAASVELLLGAQWGLSNMVAGLIQGIGAELAFFFFFYRRFHMFSCVLAGLLSSLAAVAQWFFQYGGDELSTGVLLAYTIVALVSGAILGGWLPKRIGDALKRTGVVRNYAISQAERTAIR